jgi:hemolysin-activating ACP:hemolysin acyltransferase
MTLDSANGLLDEVTIFLLSCGGFYNKVSKFIQEVILFCLAVDQYLIYRNDEGEINHFICYWNVNAEELQSICNGLQPIEKVNGSILYIVEHGNKAGISSMRRAIKDLRQRAKGMQGVIYNHAGEGMRIFTRQKGA